jgi:glycine/D-amino acid oxidase-like deaminating enzyme
MMRKRIAVVGAGAVGVCCALALQKDGHEVVLLDPAGPGEAASKGNAGVIANNMCIPLATPDLFRQLPQMLLDRRAPLRIVWPYLPWLAPWLVRFFLAARPARVASATKALASILAQALPAYRTLLSDAGMAELMQEDGWLLVYEDARRFEAARRQIDDQRHHGVRIEALSGEDLRARQPALAETIECAYLYPDCAHVLDPLVLVRRLAEVFVVRGGQREVARATVIEPAASRSWQVRTDAGDHHADAVVIAAGIWSRPLAAALGVRVPLESERGYSVTLPRPGVGLNGPILSGDYLVGLTPMGASLRIAGTVELASREAPANYARADMLLEMGQRLLPGLDGSGAERWMGHRPSTPDSLPVIGESSACPGVYFAFGHGHLGLTLAAITGDMIADLAAGRPPQLDSKPFRPERF